MLATVLANFKTLLQEIFLIFGQTGTALVLLGILALVVLWRWYGDHRKDFYINRQVEGYKETIGRLAEKEKEYRNLFNDERKRREKCSEQLVRCLESKK